MCITCFSLNYVHVDVVDCGLVVCRGNVLFMNVFLCNPFNPLALEMDI